MYKNSKVPSAILSCFLIAFILQGILKISGVFIFEKALYWEIFKIIDNHLWMQIVYYSIINCLATYCLSFSLTSKPYSKKWYHYIVIILGSITITSCRMLIVTPLFMEFIYDALLYVVIPIIINITTSRKYKLSANIVTVMALQVVLYFVYLGLIYWSNLLNSIVLVAQTIPAASTSFLIIFEAYIGLIMLMLSLNIFIRKEK